MAKQIYGNNNSYLKKIIDSNFDGKYLDTIDVSLKYYE
jgi:cysteinyl-tRNA synthetase